MQQSFQSMYEKMFGDMASVVYFETQYNWKGERRRANYFSVDQNYYSLPRYIFYNKITKNKRATDTATLLLDQPL